MVYLTTLRPKLSSHNIQGMIPYYLIKIVKHPQINGLYSYGGGVLHFWLFQLGDG